MSRAAVAASLLAVATAAAAKEAAPLNVTKGGALRPGVYGRIEPRGALPPLVNQQPVVAVRKLGPQATPVYLYVPPGQVRRWAQHCAKWQACERPVYFVRVDHSPSRLGDWSRTRHGVARPEVVAAGELQP